MSESYRPTAKSKREHGTTQSYIIGFLLSLVFTVVPYYLIVNKIATGNPLLITILGFAVLQMAVQIFFFLHLGRGPKPLYNVVFFFGTAGTILVVVIGSIFIINNLYSNMVPSQVTTKLAQDEGISKVGGQSTGACQEIYTNHEVTIKNGTLSPLHVDAKRCDTLILMNEDNTAHNIAFGSPFESQIYGGESSVTVRKGYPQTITLNQSGTYSFYDSLKPGLTGSFTVTAR